MTSAPRLLVLDAAYSLAAVRSRQLEHSVTSRDLGGFFDHVWSVHPLVGADADDSSHPFGRVTQEPLDPSNTFVEGRIGRFTWMRRLPVVNLAVSQIALFLFLWRLIRRERVTVIRAGDPYYLGLFGLMLARLNRIPLVIRVNGNYDAVYEQTGRPIYPRLLRRRSVEKRLERWIFPRADLVAGANRNNLDYALSNGARPERGTVFGYGNLIAPEHFEHPRERQGVLVSTEAGLGPLLVYVGRLEPVKHVEDVIRAFATVVTRHADAQLLLVGDGSIREELRATASALGVLDRVHFVGNKDQGWIARSLVDADVIVSPLTGRALVEAGLSATPIVAYDIEWHSEILQDRVTGRLVTYRDVEALSTAVSECLDDRSEAIAMGARCRERMLQMMNPDSLMRHEQEAYARLLGTSPVSDGA